MGIVAFIYGIIFGSFYNVVIYRAPLDMPLVKSRSICPICKTTLKPYDLIPILSWCFLLGKSRCCKNKISLRYPIIESITGLLFWLSYAQYGFGWKFFFYVSLWSMLLITSIIDYDTMLILDAVLLLFSAISSVCIFGLGLPIINQAMGALIGFGIYLTIYLIAKAVYKKEAFGFGDVMLMGSIGLCLGISNTIITCVLAFYIALLFIIISVVLRKNTYLKKEMPLGPSICIAAFIVSLYGEEILQAYFSFMTL